MTLTLSLPMISAAFLSAGAQAHFASDAAGGHGAGQEFAAIPVADYNLNQGPTL